MNLHTEVKLIQVSSIHLKINKKATLSGFFLEIYVIKLSNNNYLHEEKIQQGNYLKLF